MCGASLHEYTYVHWKRFIELEFPQVQRARRHTHVRVDEVCACKVGHLACGAKVTVEFGDVDVVAVNTSREILGQYI